MVCNLRLLQNRPTLKLQSLIIYSLDAKGELSTAESPVLELGCVVVEVMSRVSSEKGVGEEYRVGY